MNRELEGLLKEELYVQALPSRPGLTVSFPSIKLMKKGCGFCFRFMLVSFKDDYGNIFYPVKDLHEHAGIVLKNLESNGNYLVEKRRQYDREISAFEKDFLLGNSDLSAMSEKRLFRFLERMAFGSEVSVGTAHMLEGISLELGDMIKEFLEKKVGRRDLNRVFSVVSSPVNQSYLSKKDELLWQIKRAPAVQRERLVGPFISRYFWINGTFLGSSRIDRHFVLGEAERLENFKKPDFVLLKKQKKELFRKYSFSKREMDLVHLLEFLADWQDERKANMYMSVFCIDQVLQEISRRYKIELKLLQHLLLEEITLQSIKSGLAEKKARERIKGCVFLKRLGGIDAFAGKDFAEFEKAVSGKEEEDVKILTGTPASLGTATGRVRVCMSFDSISKVEKGDILVASMTRPEYLPAMKKAAAIVTDEGGVTCHAAIVSRELGIPCVIGTKIATRVLKDGWIVQVKANHGQVIVLERKEK